jgi:imidazoleglycerol-phosphate dehydratase
MILKRTSKIERKTKETEILVELNLDGNGISNIDTGLGFLNHMLDAFTNHGLFDLTVKAKGDLHIDSHHTVEDIAIALGMALNEAIGDKSGIDRIGHSILPMDETVATVAVDFSGRPYFNIKIPWVNHFVGNMTSNIIKTSEFLHFLETIAIKGNLTLYIKVEDGKDDHHMIEAVFKALGRSIYMASRINPDRQGAIPSTKGVL